MEVGGGVPNRARAKRREAYTRGRAGSEQRSPISVGRVCVWATASARSSAHLTQGDLPASAGRSPAVVAKDERTRR
jgi:hypothetical protein